MAVDWLSRGARAWQADGSPEVVLRDLRVLRKVSFPELAGAGHRLLVRGRRADGDGDGAGAGELVLRLEADDGTLHYRALLAGGGPSPGIGSEPAWTTPPDLATVDPDRIYGGDRKLFHGPRCRAIHSLTGVSTDGAEALVVGLNDLGWGGDHWYIDVAALDGGMQLAGLWAMYVVGGVLPVAVRECRIHRTGLLAGPARSIVRSRGVHDTGAHCDVAVLDDDGIPRIELLDVEMVLRPDWAGR
jgi:hypothetical protein